MKLKEKIGKLIAPQFLQKKLYQLYRKYQTKIFSANIRDYLGSRASDSNINNGIKNTVENDAGNFWVYNNGLTIITHSYDVKEGESRKIIVSGLSIVNGLKPLVRSAL